MSISRHDFLHVGITSHQSLGGRERHREWCTAKQRHVLVEERALDALQPFGRIDTEFLAEDGPRWSTARSRRPGLTAEAVESNGQLRPPALAQRVRINGLAQAIDDYRLAVGRQFEVSEFLLGVEASLGVVARAGPTAQRSSPNARTDRRATDTDASQHYRGPARLGHGQ